MRIYVQFVGCIPLMHKVQFVVALPSCHLIAHFTNISSPYHVCIFYWLLFEKGPSKN